MKNWIRLASLLVLILFSACTIMPKYSPENATIAPDSSTPVEYAKIHGIYNDGTVGYILQGNEVRWRFEFGKDKFNKEIVAALITENKLKDYYSGIDRYKHKLLNETGFKVENKEDGISEYPSKYGAFYRIEATQYANLKLMQTWELKGVEPDSAWDSTKAWIKDKFD